MGAVGRLSVWAAWRTSNLHFLPSIIKCSHFPSVQDMHWQCSECGSMSPKSFFVTSRLDRMWALSSRKHLAVTFACWHLTHTCLLLLLTAALWVAVWNGSNLTHCPREWGGLGFTGKYSFDVSGFTSMALPARRAIKLFWLPDGHKSMLLTTCPATGLGSASWQVDTAAPLLPGVLVVLCGWLSRRDGCFYEWLATGFQTLLNSLRDMGEHLCSIRMFPMLHN